MGSYILVADDKPDSRILLTLILSAGGHEVRSVESGQLALASIAACLPELVLLDIRMSEIDGFEVCRRLQASEKTRNIPIILVSEADEWEERVEGLALGAADFVTRPFHRQELLSRVRAHLELARLRARLEEEVVQRTAELRESEEMFRNIADTAPVMIWASGPNKFPAFFNKSWLAFAGPPKDHESADGGWTDRIHPEDLRRVLSAWSLSVERQRIFEVEFRFRRTDGEYRWVLSRGVPRTAPSGLLAGFVGSAVDITDIKLAQEQAYDRRRVENLRMLAGGVGHAFGNLLNSILANADLAEGCLADGCPPDDDIRLIRQEVLRASDVARELLDYAGQNRAEFGHVDLSQVVSEMATLLRASISERARLETDLQRNLPPVLGNGVQLRQLVRYLVLNASQALAEDEGVIRVATVHESGRSGVHSLDHTPGDFVRLEVSDTGCGLTEEQRAKIFDPYVTTFPGNGLNLTVVHGIVDAHRGAIDVVSAPNGGTTFKIVLPCAAESSDSIQRAQNAFAAL
jgi:PAS domain S-box-containing protein